jgi:hypothetical protein
MLRKIFGSKREEIRVDSRKRHNEELHNLYPQKNITLGSQRRRWVGV